MNMDPQHFQTELPPGRYGKVWVLPQAEIGNPTDEELTWPIVEANPNSQVQHVVEWSDRSARQLAQLFSNRTNEELERGSLVSLKKNLNDTLSVTPRSLGEGRDGGTYVAMIEDIVIHYEIIEKDNRVLILELTPRA